MGLLKREKQFNDFRSIRQFKIQIRKSTFLGKKIYVDTVGRNKKQIQEYIKHQLDEDQLADQLSIKEYIDPFTGSENKKANK